jgi:2-keto-4-pentenoate hydratase/2-oxohepta-3-ene-1,7-dioic acid hydratase in catechol pathway
MIYDYPELISHWSKMGLAPGDLVSGGTPAGVAFRRPVPSDFYLQPGDKVKAEATGLGTLEIEITD